METILQSRTVTLDVTELRAALTLAAPIMRTRTAIPVLRSVRLNVDDETATVTATDLDDSIVTRLLDVVTLCPNAEPITVLLPYADTKSFLTKKRGPIEVTYTPGGDVVTLSAAGTSTDLRTASTAEYPVDDGGDFGEPFPVQLADIREVFPATSSDDSRPILAGILFDGPDRVIVATDSYRLHAVDAVDVGPDVAIVNRSTVALAIKAAGKKADVVTMAYRTREGNIGTTPTPTRVRFDAGNSVIVGRVVEGEFPRWRSLLPTSSTSPNRIVIGADPTPVLAPMTKYDQSPARVSAESTDVGGGGVMLTCTAVDRGTIAGTVPGSFPNDLDLVGFNPAYLIDALDGVDYPVTFRGSTTLRPWSIDVTRGDGSRRIRLLMPVRIS